MRVICLQCGTEQEDRTGIPASKNIPREQGVSVCAKCGGIWAVYVEQLVPADGEGVILGDGKRYLRARDLPATHPALDWPVKHMYQDYPTYWAPLRDDPDMLVARV